MTAVDPPEYSLTVYSAKFDIATRTLSVDVEVTGTPPAGQFYIFVWGRQDGGSAVWEGLFPAGRRTVTSNAHPLYYIKGLTVQLDAYRITPSGEEAFLYLTSVSLAPDQIVGLSDYLAWRNDCLSKAKWKVEISIYFEPTRTYMMGGFVAIYRAVLDKKAKTVTVDVQVDGTTRYDDVYTVWFGVPGYLLKSAGIGRSTVTLDLSDPFYWNMFQTYGFRVQPMDYSWALVDGFNIMAGEMEILYATRISISAPDQTVAGRSFTVSGKLEYESDTEVWSPLGYRTVSLYCNDTKIADVTTGTDGSYSVAMQIPKAGTYTLKAVFPGEGLLAAATFQGLTVSPEVKSVISLALPIITGAIVAYASMKVKR
jgi:hypothetical protein